MKRVKKEGFETITANISKELKRDLDLYSIASGMYQKDVVSLALSEFLKGKKDFVEKILELQKNI